MGRPIKNNIDYFPHQRDMRNDRKIKAVRAKFGIDGYAIYNMMLEVLSESELLLISWNEMEIEMIAGDFGVESEKLIETVEYFVKIDLLQTNNGYLFCKQLEKRAEYVFAKRTENLNSLRSRNGVNFTKTDVPDPKSTQSKVKESKENIYVTFFDEFWKLYPKRKGKKLGKSTCLSWWKKYAENDYDKIIAATKNYAVSDAAKNNFARDPIRFLKSEYWHDWLDVEKPCDNIPPMYSGTKKSWEDG